MSKRSERRIRKERELQEREARLLIREQGLSPVAVVERAVQESDSKQPRFSALNPSSVFTSIYNLVRLAECTRPSDKASVREWDAWYRKFAMTEPFLSGVLNSVIQIDKNRGWTLTGGRNQVNRYTQILHEVDDGAGWREYCSWLAQSYYTARMGFVSEIGRDGEGGPMRALWGVDPARCQLTGNIEKPLRYYPKLSGQQEWLPQDYFRNAALISTDEAELGLGNPAIARCLYLAEILIAVWEHDKEQLGARAPRGLLLLNGISEQQWETAMQEREEALNSLERKYYGGVAILASSGADEIKASLVALSQLPKDFSVKEFTDLAMFGFALAFGYDAREFWPVSSGGLGTGNEVVTGHRKTSSKGELDFSLALQEKIQKELPPAIEFQFERRDDEGEKLDAEKKLAKAQVITEVSKWVVNNASVLNAQQIMELAAKDGVIPDDWTLTEEDVTATDTEEVEEARHNPHIQRAAEQFPSEPIIRYSYPSGKVHTIADRASELFKRRSYPVAVAPMIEREQHTGAMIAFYPSSDVAESLALPDGETAESLHLTLCYLGDTEKDNLDREKIAERVSKWAEQHEPITGKIGGLARFLTNESDKTNAIVALFDSPQLPEFRQSLMGVIGDLAIEQNHGFIPHITLAYVSKDDPMPEIQLEAQEITFNQVAFVYAGERTFYQLNEQRSIERSIESTVNRFAADLRNLVTVGFISDSSILADMRKLIKDGVANAYVSGLEEGDVSGDEMDSDDMTMIVELTSEQLDHVTDFCRDIRAAKGDTPEAKALQRDILDNRIPLWVASINAAAIAGLNSAKRNEMVVFGGDDGEESCDDCQRYKTEAHRRKWFQARNLIPGKPGSALKCAGYQCRHELVARK